MDGEKSPIETAGDFTKKNVVIFSQETWGYDKQILRISPGYLAA